METSVDHHFYDGAGNIVEEADTGGETVILTDSDEDCREDEEEEGGDVEEEGEGELDTEPCADHEDKGHDDAELAVLLLSQQYQTIHNLSLKVCYIMNRILTLYIPL